VVISDQSVSVFWLLNLQQSLFKMSNNFPYCFLRFPGHWTNREDTRGSKLDLTVWWSN